MLKNIEPNILLRLLTSLFTIRVRLYPWYEICNCNPFVNGIR